MRAGQRNNYVIIERATDTRGDFGEVVKTWATQERAWVNIQPVAGGETIQGGQVDAKVTHKITFRDADVTAADRINHGGRYFNITRVFHPEGRGADEVALAIEDV